MKNIYQVLQDLEIQYAKHEHPAVFTVEDANKYVINTETGHSKNLFLRNRKGNKYYLVVLESEKKADLKKLAVTLGEKGLSFATEEKLMKYLGLTPGSVSPFGLINDLEKVVTVLIDTELMQNETIGFHPNINTATLVVNTGDFKKFLKWTGNEVIYLEI
ncbi:prolyl-tRNA synthetase associated domain-containing protein [Candidatus Roizmanbacteria bacterium CG_4_9_14_0_2_um_filter_39_13]|uniref:Prolyl-tRNA synthetase associated domain-containing protein n=2 Tax=Candidatus Roizmaniibacteriota TaxID=1752723 RepID=A0A2M8EZP9_9BACT|nr:MAG: prolyl-tRNA synthetase associated domain-containing protein [Candidatus Roizmanbacteria bacterium CG_4_10_14_0_2_um_filter_39_12]PJC32518.1 MAG: prolyl-tRNA synthetase associated domain-containing protein [Candidatus Roizmanbacteria bacterium CG_4_9_14_0_2_um_filter_39_13]PJE61905.1 MAG: prolyl-tRNA synthetase associated domain-containing protein [Candidatus Roizmanbacteria bacterium CG10_big_fil_rev_8_21_14_0_10_39_12]